MKFVLFVEGHTERSALPDFFRRWLNGQLPNRVGIKTVRFEGWRDYFDEIDKKVSLNLSGEAGLDIIAGIGLLDLYGPTFYPNHLTTAVGHFNWAKQEIERKVQHPRFRQYFAVHETEAWLLANPDMFPVEVRASLPGRTPESVNFDDPPKKLLKRLYRERLHRRYNQVTDGTNLFAQLDPAQAGARCPYLRQLLDDLLNLARSV